MKFFPLNSSIVQKLRHSHPALKGRRLLDSGKFSGIFEGSTENSVFKLSIDKASYIFNTKSDYNSTNQHFIKLNKDYGQVGIYALHHNIRQSKATLTNLTQVPIYLYEVEKLYKITTNTKNYELAQHLVNNWQKFHGLSCSKDLNNSIVSFVSHLKHLNSDQQYSDTIINALENVANFISRYAKESAFTDLHSSNMMQRNDGTFVFSDPIADFQIYSHFYLTFNSFSFKSNYS
jgi:hypothetical protein